MKVHFSSSASNMSARYDRLKFICDVITSEGHKLAKDWLNEAFNATESEKQDLKRWERISTETVEALRSSDVVIIESSIDSFSMGYQAGLAIQLKKPLLILREDGSKLPETVNVYDVQKSVEHTLIAAKDNSYKIVKAYKDEKELAHFISKFLKENDISNKDLRFNMFLDRQTYQYLQNQSNITGQTRAKLIRDMIRDKMSE